jgi:ATP-binding cassette, subfamily B, bacterial
LSRRSALRDRLRDTLHFRRALRLVWESAPGWTVASGVLVFVQGVLPLVLLYLTKLIVDEVAAGIGGPDTGIAFERVAWLIALAALVSLFGVVLRILGGLVSEIQAHLVTDHALAIVHRKSTEVDYSFYEDSSYHDTLHRTQQEAPGRPTQVVNSLLHLGQSIVTALGVVVLLATVHWLLVVVLFLAVLPGLWVRVRYADRTYRWSRERAGLERQAGYTSLLLTNGYFAKDVRMAGLGPLLLRRFSDLRTKLREERIRLSRSRSLADIATQSAAALAVFGSYVFIAHQTLAGVLTLGSLVMYFQAVQRGQTVLQEMLSGLARLYEHNLFLHNLEEFLEIEPRIVAPPDPLPVPRPLRSGLVVEGVGFQYPGGSRRVLHDVSLSVRPGEMVALIGANGCGKTTLLKLLARLYEPDSGSIRLDGVDLRQFDPAELRRNIAVLFQDFACYAYSVRDNIWFGRVHEPPDEARIVRAAEDAGFTGALSRLPEGYDTILGRQFERGSELSGGEWQKLALARAFYSDAQLLILDEPSSALDARAEADLFTQIRRDATDRAAIVVSHRFSTVRMADRIYVMDEGRIIEGGTHEELVRLAGTYARLFEIQAAPYRSNGSEAIRQGVESEFLPDRLAHPASSPPAERVP